MSGIYDNEDFLKHMQIWKEAKRDWWLPENGIS